MKKTPILMVDDDLINLLLLEKMLKSLDLNIVKAGSGFEALELIETYDFALVLLDAQMPELDGFETANKIRARSRHQELPIIIVSAVSKSKEFIIKGYKAGAVDYLLKPIDQFLLLSKVKIFCELHQKKQLLKKKNTELALLNEKLNDEIIKRKEAEQKLLYQAIRDPLTGLFNRRYLEESLDREIAKAKRHHTPLGLLMLDVDHFKVFNDTYGHLAGDMVLRNLSELLIKKSRKEDIACRYGGEEFVLMLPGTALQVAAQRAEILRKTVAGGEMIIHENKALPSITISIGVAILPEHALSTTELITAADQALYKAKENGRNRIEAAPPLKAQNPKPDLWVDEASEGSSGFQQV